MIDRLRLALDSQIGTIFIGLLIFLCILWIMYMILSLRQKKRDILVYRNRNYYEKVNHLTVPFKWGSEHQADFLGRQTVVQFAEGGFALCLVPTEDLAQTANKEKFKLYCRAIQHQKLPSFAQIVWKSAEELWMIVQSKVLQNDGCFKLSLKHYMKDARLNETEIEKILLDLASALNDLHKLRDEKGKKLYHGLLLPSFIFLDLNETMNLKGIVIAHHGLAFSVGSRQIYHKIVELRSGKLPLEKHRSQELYDQLGMLAPEQKDPDCLHEVGAACDFFAYGALAVSLFTKKSNTDVKSINWDMVPEKWKPFLQRCLENNISKRPGNFGEIENWLSDPELALTHFSQMEWESKQHEQIDTTSISSMMHQIRESRLSTRHSSVEFNNCFSSGLKFTKLGKWEQAQSHFKNALKIDPLSAEANVQLAIVSFELGLTDVAQEYYAKAKKLDNTVGKKFLEHMTLRL